MGYLPTLRMERKRALWPSLWGSMCSTRASSVYNAEHKTDISLHNNSALSFISLLLQYPHTSIRYSTYYGHSRTVWSLASLLTVHPLSLGWRRGRCTVRGVTLLVSYIKHLILVY